MSRRRSPGILVTTVFVALGVIAAPAARGAERVGGAAESGGLTARAEAFLAAGPAVAERRIVGGTRAPISAFPWQVDVWSETSASVTDCGGSIIDASTVLTAAHCVEDTTPGAAPTKGGLAVWAGTASISSKTATSTDRLNLQERRVASARVHPQWRHRVATSGDLALLHLASPLELDGRTVTAIPLPGEVAVPISAVFPVAPSLTVSGFGLTTGGGGTDGRLRSLPIAPVDPDACDDDDNAIEICAQTASGTACSGDSGGPVIAPGPVLVGVVSNGPRTCPPGGANRYVNLATPENRAFLLGADDPPLAPRRSSPARFTRNTTALRVGQTLTCDGGDFTGDSAQHSVITTDDGTIVLLSSGNTATVSLSADLVGHQLRCRGYGSSDGGIGVSNVAESDGAVRASTGAAPSCSAGAADAKVTVLAPSQARRASRITVSATLAAPSDGAEAALIVLRRSTSGAGAVRRIASITGSGGPRLRISYQLPRSLAAGKSYGFQLVVATFPSREAARRASGLAGACDAGDASFRVRIVR